MAPSWSRQEVVCLPERWRNVSASDVYPSDLISTHVGVRGLSSQTHKPTELPHLLVHACHPSAQIAEKGGPLWAETKPGL